MILSSTGCNHNFFPLPINLVGLGNFGRRREKTKKTNLIKPKK